MGCLRPLQAILLAVSAACANPPADWSAWTAATQEIRSAMEQDFARLSDEVLGSLEAGNVAESDARQLLAALGAEAQPHAAAWRALAEHCARLEPLVQALPYDPRGAWPAAESWRRMVLALQAAGAVTAADRDAAARSMARARDAAHALDLAARPTAALGEELAAFHLDFAARVRSAGAELDLRLAQGEEGRRQREAALALLVAEAEDQARKVAAGAGRADPGMLEHLGADREALAQVRTDLAAAAARRAAVAALFAAEADRMQLVAYAARDWALAHAEAARALAAGAGRPEFRRIRSSAEGLAQRRASG